MASTNPLNDPSVDPFDVARDAAAVIAEQSGGIAVDDLKRDALAMFGGKRITQAIGARLDEALARALTSGVLTLQASGIVGTSLK